MLTCMRTTLVLDDRLFRDAKRRAASRGITLSELVGQALRAELARRSAPAGRFEIVTFAGGAGAVHHEPEAFAAAMGQEDEASLGR